MSEAAAQQSYTYGDYLGWGDEIRCELIDGMVYDMTPAPSTIHQGISGELFFQIRTRLGREGPCRVYSAPFDVRMPEAGEADEEVKTVVQPDISVICDPSKLDERGCRGAPDWVIEILSPSTAVKDHMRKLEIYEKHGVREYWIVDPANRIVMVYRPGADGLYGKPRTSSASDRVETGVIEGIVIDLGTIFRE